jgi:hypothetical protein
MPATTYRHSGEHISVASASAALTGGTLAIQEGWFGVVIAGVAQGLPTELEVEGVHNILVPAGVLKGDTLWADLSGGDAASITLTETYADGYTLIGKASTDRDSGGRAQVKLAAQPGNPPNGKRVVNLAAPSQTLTAAQSGQKFVGVVDAVFTLPAAAAGTKGVWYEFECGALSVGTGLSISPAAADHIRGNGLTSVDDKDLINSGATDRLGDRARIYCDGVDGWVIEEVVGTWAKE